MSHLVVDDDSLLFCYVESPECDEAMKIIETYEKASGQCINFNKLSFLFGKWVLREMQYLIKNVWGSRMKNVWDSILKFQRTSVDENQTGFLPKGQNT